MIWILKSKEWAPEAILLRNEYFIWLSSWLHFLHCYHWTKEDEWSTYIRLKKVPKTHILTTNKRSLIDWLGGDQKRYHQKNIVLYVFMCVCVLVGLLTRQKKSMKKHRSNLSIIDGVVVGISADSYTAFFPVFFVYLQTVDWKMPYFYNELTFIFVITRTIRSINRCNVNKKKK